MRFLPHFARASSFTLVACLVGACGDSGATAGGADSGVATDSAADPGGDGTTTTDSTTGDAPAETTPGDAPADAPSDGADTTPGGDASGKPCTATGGECTKAEYCNAPSCGSGHCAARPPGPGLDFQPVCGCDGVTYWNAQQAHASGASTDDSSTGSSCSGPSTKTCGGLVGATCPAGDKCIEDLSGFPTCTVADAGGQCWYVPGGASCSGVAFSQYRDCSTSTCVSYCEAVKSGHSFRRDSSCPT